MKNNTSNNDNDTNNNSPYNIPLTPSDPENKVDIKAVHKSHQRRVLRKHFKSFIAFMDQHVDYYLLNMSNAIVTNEKNEDVKNVVKVKSKGLCPIEVPKNGEKVKPGFVPKNGDDVLLPLPIDAPDSTRETRETRETKENKKEKEIEVFKVDIDDKYACYDTKCFGCVCKRIPFKVDKVDIDVEIKNIKDLIDLCDNYKLAVNVEYNINMQALHKIRNDLIDLNNMIGMKNLKENIVDQLLYYLQNLHIPSARQTIGTGSGSVSGSSGGGDFLHTVIYGSPGTGKTEVAKIIGRIYSNLGVIKNKGLSSSGTYIPPKKKSSLGSGSGPGLSSNSSSSGANPGSKFKKVTRSDLIAGYLGQTALKTKDAIKDSIGGVLFIDEAYALGNTEKRDSFSKECIDTLCEALSDHKDDLMVIIAGYEKDLNECFFAYNDGLDSRFTWRFKIDDYTAEDLRDIFTKKVRDFGWSIYEGEEIKEEWFGKHMKYFKYYGRDMETLFSKTKIAHSRRVFCKPENVKTKITMKDLENGFEMYTNNDEVKKRADNNDIKVIENMYL
jgi:hypothetical protein